MPQQRKSTRRRTSQKPAAAAVTGPAKVYVIACTPSSSRSVQAGQPPTTLASYLLDVPDGSDSTTIVGEFIAAQQFAPTTIFGVVDASLVDAIVLTATLEPGDALPGESGS